MVRTQIQLTEKQSQALKKLSAQRGDSLAELIRQSVDLLLNTVQNRERTMAEKRVFAKLTVDQFHSGLSDLGQNHDAYLVDAYLDNDLESANEP